MRWINKDCYIAVFERFIFLKIGFLSVRDIILDLVISIEKFNASLKLGKSI